jgi:hypothetical protein
MEISSASEDWKYQTGQSILLQVHNKFRGCKMVLPLDFLEETQGNPIPLSINSFGDHGQ